MLELCLILCLFVRHVMEHSNEIGNNNTSRECKWKQKIYVIIAINCNKIRS